MFDSELDSPMYADRVLGVLWKEPSVSEISPEVASEHRHTKFRGELT